MTENTNSEQVNRFQKQENKEEMKRQVISFALMIIFTLIAFGIVATGNVPSLVAIPALFIMALVQVAFQFYYFMHLKEKDHEMPTVLMYGGVWGAFLVLAGLGLISWW